MKEILDNSINLIITSPPYFNAKDYSINIKDDLGNINDYALWLNEIKKVWKECFRVLQRGRKIFINIMDLPVKMKVGFQLLPLKSDTIKIMQEIGFVYKQEIIWLKTNGVQNQFGSYPYPGAILLNNMHESILEFEKVAPTWYKKYKHISKENRDKSKLTKEEWIEIKKSNVWILKPYKAYGREHIAPFPIDLPERIIKAYSFMEETVLDPFGGSGSTIIACENLNRKGIMFEINIRFKDMILDKLINFHPDILNKIILHNEELLE
jgi:DNA modification methylase